DPAATVANMVRMLRRVIGEDIELVVRAEPDVARVRVDPSQLEQVVLNLAVNARDAMDRGGRLTIETRNLTISAADAADYPGAAPGDYVAIRVHDTGAGIPPDVLPHIFEPFFTTKDRGKGTGLGLATVYGIISQSGGHIHADSTLGVGTSFRILLPAIRETPPDETPAAPKRLSGGAETVLLVEDEPSVRSLARRVLERQGYTVLEAADGEAAIGVAAQHRDRIDLLLTDVVMPRMSGRTLAGHLAELRPGLRVLFMSGYADELRGRRGAVDEGIAFLQKPFTPEDLATRVRALLDAPVADAAG
ncbi:MAG TPA: ATP-binding protein, partial [Longimicrobiales bacterium]|nr:ATP-binding protein [Longimicrobiales bacterium]